MAKKGKENIGSMLLRDKMITPEQLRRAIEEQKTRGGRLGYNLTKLGFLREEELAEFLSKEYGVPSASLSRIEIDPEILKIIPKEIVKKYKVIPIDRTGSTLQVAMSDPTNIFVIDEIRFLTGYNVEPAVAAEHSIVEAIEKYYVVTETMADVMADIGEDDMEIVEEDNEVSVTDLEKATHDAPVVRLVNLIISDAVKINASDIHIEPYEKTFRVRYRLDGVLHEKMQPPLQLKYAISSRLKIMSNLDIAERRLPQDGRMRMRIMGKEIDFRVSVMPTIFGEKVVMRLLDKETLQLDMTKLGFEEGALNDFKDGIYQPYGMVLVTGPTGSGKTTTLYSSLKELNKITTNISTAEDPVEYNLPGINQIQMHDDIGLNFATTLRSLLRQDPDVILVGEIRDYETAEIAVKAALTGHLVLSTLHTNDAPSSISRLLNMGIEPFLIASSTNTIMAQRLVRKVCQDCKKPAKVPEKALTRLGIPSERASKLTLYKGEGCRSCADTGYKGRIAVFEVMPVTESVKELILQGASTSELKRESIKSGMKTLRQSAVTMMEEGITTLEEVLRVTMRD